MLNFDVVVIGCGVAGITSAIYLKRANLNVCIIEKNAPGGQLNMISEINNYPGYKSIDGPTFAYNLFEQINNLNIPYKYGNVLEIVNKRNKKIIVTNKEKITCKGVIIATGRKPRELGIENEKKLLGSGISYCAICDGSLYKDKEVVVVGGGNSAIENAIYLSKICKKIYLIHRNENIKADNILLEKLNKIENIEIILNSKINMILEKNDRVSGILINNDREIMCEAIFINIGNVPVLIKCDNLKTTDGYIVVNKNMKTNINKIYACGDIIKKDVYQITTAVSEGTIAAINLANDINN